MIKFPLMNWFIVETFLTIKAKFGSFMIDIQFFFIDLKIIVKSIFYVLDFVSFAFLSIDLQKVLIYQFMLEVIQIFKFLLWLNFQTVQ